MPPLKNIFSGSEKFMTAEQIAQHLEKLRTARQMAQASDNEAEWSLVDRLHRELQDHAEDYCWYLLAENKTLNKRIAARETAENAIRMMKEA